MAYDAKAVANYILDIADERGVAVSPMKLLKLVYFSHGWHLAVTGKPLLNEQVEAWKFGPVVSELYHEFKAFGNSPINGRASDIDAAFNIETPSLPDDADGSTAKQLITKV